MALKGIKVVEMLGLAPAPFCGMLLAEFGAAVTVVDKIEPSLPEVLSSGKRNIALNLKDPQGITILKELCKSADVLIEPFRAGVMEKLGLGPDILQAENPKLVYARLTGYGQNGPLARMGGHDINYVSISGLLSMLARHPARPFPPINYAADFAGGGLLCTLGIVMALFERTSSNRGQVIDCSMTEGTAYISSWLYRSQKMPIWGNVTGKNVLDGGAHFYDTYETKDGKYMALGALEPKFYQNLLSAIDSPISADDQMMDFDKQREVLKDVFLKKTREEWTEIFKDVDACTTPVISIEEAPDHPHNKFRESFTKAYDGQMVPKPAPILDRTPANSLADKVLPQKGEHTQEILSSLNYSIKDIKKLHEAGVVYSQIKSNL